MNSPPRGSRPRLSAGCRLNESAVGGPVLLMPERALRLNPTGLAILRLCDGQRTVVEIVAMLTEKFSVAQQQQVGEETSHFIEKLQEIRAIDFD